MLFNSYVFIFAFLPATLALFHFFRSRVSFQSSVFVLVVASLVFYGWWSPKYLCLLLALIVFNYILALNLIRFKQQSLTKAKLFLAFGIVTNLSVLFYYKYANFFVDNLNEFFKSGINIPAIILPIGISFFTFQKIAFLVDIYEGKVGKVKLVDYALFVTFFPQLIAGPITHHSEVIPQFTEKQMRVTRESIELGLSFFIIGLAKKMLIADVVAKFSTIQFKQVIDGTHLDMLGAWSAALCYTVQLYFDFSAYTDMAIGLGLFFGIHLPLNFNSPYKSTSIVDFWRRWHMTLSRFLRDYLYIPLGGNKKGEARRYINLFLTMLLGGIWHGAGWTFMIWGALHGAYLTINHGWRIFWAKIPHRVQGESWVLKKVSQLVTFLAVVVGWIFFRSPNVETALDILQSMVGKYGLIIPPSLGRFYPEAMDLEPPVDTGIALALGIVFLLMAWLMPNTQEIMGYVGPESTNKTYQTAVGKSWFQWKASLPWALYLGVLLALSLMMFTQVSEFIYFQF